MERSALQGVRKFVLMALGILVVALAACSDGDETSPDPTTVPGGEGGAVPEDVQAIEEGAEGAIDMALAGNWDEVVAQGAAIEQSWSAFLASEDASGVTEAQKTAMEAAIADLQAAASATDDLAARQAANDVSKVIIHVYDLFEPTIPTGVGRLDYLERQVIIDAERGEWTLVVADVAEVQQTFDRVKDSVEASGGTDEVQEFEASIASQTQQAAAEDTAIIAEANVALELVDSLESVF